MPPEKTNLTFDAGRDVVGLRVDADITLVNEAAGGGLPIARSDVAVLTDAFSEKEAAGPQATSTRSFLSLLRGHWYAFQERRQRARSRVSLHHLRDRELMDIGLTRGDVDYIDAHRGFERLRDGTAYLWRSHGGM
jgi:uncharacterized protein YjiS (DUF1127 family)